MTVRKLVLPCLALFAAAISPAAIADDGGVLRYSLIFLGDEIGFQTVRHLGDGRFKVHYRYDDNGRGPNIEAVYQLDDNGIPLSIDITGKDWVKADIDEHFAVEGETARWNGLQERGESAWRKNTFYVAHEGLAFDMGLLAAALAEAPGNRLALLPGGEVHGRVLTTLQIADQVLELHELDGMAIESPLLWLDETGKLAAVLYGKTSMLVRNDLLGVRRRLVEKQFEIETAREAARIERFMQPAAGLVVFRNVDVFDAERAKVTPDKDVYVYDGRITSVRDTGAPPPEDARVIEGDDATLLPGLWDMHTHRDEAEQGFQDIAFGVTSIRELGNEPDEVLELKRLVEQEAAIGPRRVLAGFIEGKSEYSSSGGIVAATLDEAIAAVDWYADRGFMQIKIYNSIKPEWVKPMADHAHARGLRVSGHVPAFMTAEDAIDAGYDEINHINMVFLNFLQQPGDDTRTITRFTRIGEDAAALDLDSPEVERFIQRLKTENVVIEPNMNPFLVMMRSRPGVPSELWKPMFERLPVLERRDLKTWELAIPPEQDANYRNAAVALQKMLRKLHEDGVTLIPGTDSQAAGMMLHLELNEWVKAGIPAAEVLRAATLVSAQVAGRAHELGSIERGKLADLILVDGNPAENIGDLRRIRLVMQGDRLYDAPAMLEELNIKP